MKKFALVTLAILYAPIGLAFGALAFGVLGMISIPLSVRVQFEQRKWLRDMERLGRTLAPAEIAERGGSGTLIVEQPGWGGKVKRCWWTPDDLDSLSPEKITSLPDRMKALEGKLDADSLSLDRWIYDTYLSRDCGTAYLIAAERGGVVASQLQSNMVNLKLTETWTAPVGEFVRNAG